MNLNWSQTLKTFSRDVAHIVIGKLKLNVCLFGLPRVPFVNCRQFMYLVVSLLVLRAGCGI